jgi:hypothetical protein
MNGMSMRCKLQEGDRRVFVLARCWVAVALVGLTGFTAGCHKKSAQTEPVAGQKTFASTEEAGKALAEAAQGNNRSELLAIFGSNSETLISSGDAAQDKSSLSGFASDYNAMHRWRKLDNGSQLLVVGVTNTAFAIPVRKSGDNRWFFDMAAGKSELQVRRIGRNELAAIDILAALADAQVEYYSQTHDGVKQYARKFISDPGKLNGLYWPTEPGKPKSPIGPQIAYATREGSKLQAGLHQPFHGYYFGILDTQGASAAGGLRDYHDHVHSGIMTRGFAFVAYPAEYGKSGVMTFIINRDRVVYQKDFGPTTEDKASFMTQFNPEGTWREVKQ